MFIAIKSQTPPQRGWVFRARPLIRGLMAHRPVSKLSSAPHPFPRYPRRRNMSDAPLRRQVQCYMNVCGSGRNRYALACVVLS